MFCKPSEKNQTLYQSRIDADKILSLRSVILEQDAEMLHQWVNEPYAKKFWQLDVSKNQFLSFYQSLLNNPDAHSYISFLNNEPVCQIDLYRVEASDLGKYLKCGCDDCGMHLLMAPLYKAFPGLSRIIMQTFMQYYYSFLLANILYAEPDKLNYKACRLLEKSGFTFLQHITLTDKEASLYLMTRKNFYETYSLS